MSYTDSPGRGLEPEGAVFRRAVIFGGLGVLSGVIAGLVEWSQVLDSFYFEFPVPGTQAVWYLTTYTISYGIVFGVLLALALQRYRIAREYHLTPIVVATAVAAFVASNVAGGMVPANDVETSFWMLIGVIEGLLFAGITLAALAALYPLYRQSPKIFPVLIAGAAAGGLGELLAFGMLYPDLNGARDEAIALALPLAVYTGIMLGGTGAALGAVSTPPAAGWATRGRR